MFYLALSSMLSLQKTVPNAHNANGENHWEEFYVKNQNYVLYY